MKQLSLTKREQEYLKVLLASRMDKPTSPSEYEDALNLFYKVGGELVQW